MIWYDMIYYHMIYCVYLYIFPYARNRTPPGLLDRQVCWRKRQSVEMISQWFDLSSVSIPILLRCFFSDTESPPNQLPCTSNSMQGHGVPMGVHCVQVTSDTTELLRWLMAAWQQVEGMMEKEMEDPLLDGIYFGYGFMYLFACRSTDTHMNIYIFIQIHQTSWSTDHALMPLLDVVYRTTSVREFVSLKVEGLWVFLLALHLTTEENAMSCLDAILVFLRGDTMP